MKISTQQQFILFGVIVIVLSVGGIFMLFTRLIPGLVEARTTLDDRRAQYAATQQQVSDLRRLEQQLDEQRVQQTAFDAETWSFRTEDAFFEAWRGWASQLGLAIEQPAVADAIPGASSIERSFSVNASGSLAQVGQLLDKMQSHSPLIAIRQVEVTPGSSSRTVTIHIEGSTIWK